MITREMLLDERISELNRELGRFIGMAEMAAELMRRHLPGIPGAVALCETIEAAVKKHDEGKQ